LPRTYAPEIYKKKCGVVFEHVFEAFPNEWREEQKSAVG